MYFYVKFLFFKVFFNFTSVAKAAFCKSRAHRGTPKGGKMSLLFLSDKTAFLHVFLRAISFFNSFSIFLSLQKQQFASLERIVVPPKEEKCHFSFFLIKRHFCMYFYVPFHFFKLFFNFPFVAKAAFCKSRAHGGTPKGGKISVPFFLNQMAFLHVFLRAISFFQSLFQFYFRCKSSILQV